jgi:hypothetical protein
MSQTTIEEFVKETTNVRSLLDILDKWKSDPKAKKARLKLMYIQLSHLQNKLDKLAQPQKLAEEAMAIKDPISAQKAKIWKECYEGPD